MLVKTKIAVAAVLIFGAASVALAADDDQKGGFRELGPGGTVKEGVNPADHPSLSGQRPSTERRLPQTEGRGPSTSEKQDQDDKSGSDYGSNANK